MALKMSIELRVSGNWNQLKLGVNRKRPTGGRTKGEEKGAGGVITDDTSSR